MLAQGPHASVALCLCLQKQLLVCWFIIVYIILVLCFPLQWKFGLLVPGIAGNKQLMHALHFNFLTDVYCGSFFLPVLCQLPCLNHLGSVAETEQENLLSY